MQTKLQFFQRYWVWAALGLLAFLPFLGAAPLFDWDEINFAESAREMIVSGNYFQVQINFEPFWEKPPLFFWMQVISMKLFGINEFAARFPNAVIGIFTLVSLFRIGSRLHPAQEKRFGVLVAAFYFISILPHLYFKSGIIDPTFNFFIFLGLAHLFRYDLAWTKGEQQDDRMSPLLAGMWIGLATLTKGPVALLVTGLVYLIYKAIWGKFRIPWADALKFLVIFLTVIGAWFGSILIFTPDGGEIIGKFIVYQVELFSQPVAGHQQPFYYHFVIFLIGCFPMAAFAVRGMFVKPQDQDALFLKRFMLVWWWVIMILFTIVKTKIVHYSSMTYFPGAFLAAFFFVELMERRKKVTWDIYFLYGLGLLVFGFAVSGINLVTSNLESLKEQIADPFAQANLEAPVQWTGWEFVPAAIFSLALVAGLVMLIRKKWEYFLLIHLVATPIYLNGLNGLIVPKVAEYTQGGAVNFFSELAGHDVYLTVEGYKSYAHYFYGQVKPLPDEIVKSGEDPKHYYRFGDIDHPVYMAIRIDRLKEDFSEKYPDFREIDRASGFVFFYRDPVIHQ